MTIPMRLRKRDASGRWPAPAVQSSGAEKGPKPGRRHVSKSGGVERRKSGNTKRRMPQARALRHGRKGAIESRSHGGAYGSRARAHPDER